VSDIPQVDDLQVDDLQVEIRRAATGLLARREHSKQELAVKLYKKYSSRQDLIAAEIDQLESEDLQSDARLAEAFVRARANRGHGPIKIRGELRGKGLTDDVIAPALDESEVDWFELVQVVAAKKYAREFGDQPPRESKDRAKLARFLQQRGFSFDHISSLY
jgi:regulatory protein